jgi:MFS transporter, PHS family, inorganic phosphate transporter
MVCLQTLICLDFADANRLPHVLEIFALFMFLGIFTTFCIPETARKTLEELAGEDQNHNVESEADVREISKEAAVEEKITA